MKAKDVIGESVARNNARTPGELKPSYDYANPGALTGKGMDRYYDLYRASMMMGRLPSDLDNIDEASWLNNTGYFGYTNEVDKAKIEAAFKALGLPVIELIEQRSEEMPEVNTKSPVIGFKGYPGT